VIGYERDAAEPTTIPGDSAVITVLWNTLYFAGFDTDGEGKFSGDVRDAVRFGTFRHAAESADRLYSELDQALQITTLGSVLGVDEFDAAMSVNRGSGRVIEAA